MNILKSHIKSILSITAVTLASVLIWLGAVMASDMIEDTAIARLAFGSLVTLLTFALLYGVLRFLDKKPFSFIFGKNNLRAFFVGAGFFTIPAVIGLTASILFGFVEITPQASPTAIAISLLLVAALVCISEALPEELIFRGYLFKKLSAFTKAGVTIALQAGLFLFFAFLIGAANDLLDASFLLTFAITLGIVRATTGSVWAAIGFHLACMTFQQGFITDTWSLFTVSNPSTLQMYVFAMIPFSITITILVIHMSRSKQLR